MKYGIYFDPNPSDKPEIKVEELKKVEEVKSTKQKHIINGREIELEPHEVNMLLHKGAQKYQEETEKPDKKEEVKEPEDKLDSKYATKQELAEERLQRAKLELNRELSDLAKAHDLTKEDEMAETVRTLTLAEMQKNPSQKLADVYKAKVKFLGDKVAKGKSEYVDKKIEDASATKGPSAGSSPGMKPDKPTGKGIMTGAVRKGVLEKIKTGVYK